jgi:hypothetical protein
MSIIFGALIIILLGYFGLTVFGKNPVSIPVIQSASNAVATKSQLAARVTRYRNTGASSGGLSVAFSYAVDDLDYKLMAADNSSAKAWQRITGNPKGEDVTIGRWYSIKRGSDLSKRNDFGNSEGTDGYTESAYMSVVNPKYYRSPEEVVWHRLRVNELKKKGMSETERMHLMDSERQILWNK